MKDYYCEVCGTYENLQEYEMEVRVNGKVTRNGKICQDCYEELNRFLNFFSTDSRSREKEHKKKRKVWAHWWVLSVGWILVMVMWILQLVKK